MIRPRLLLLSVLLALGCANGNTPGIQLVDDVGTLDDVKPDDVFDAPDDASQPPVDTARDALPNDTARPDVTPPEDLTDAAEVTDAEDARDASDVCSGVCNGTCTDTATDPTHCGVCGRDCTILTGVDPARVRCTRGTCDLTDACRSGRAHCSANPMDGCESVVTTATRCGTCTGTCREPTPVCGMVAGSASGFGCVSGCVSPTPSRCGTTCVNTDADARNCGACGTVCASGANAVASCVSGACATTCITGYGDCDGVATNGCETLLRSNASNCGACGMTCASVPNATPTCSLSACALVCATGFANCDATYATGCETDTRTSITNCGVCGRACVAAANSTPSCAAGVCTLTCAPGFGDCDRLASNGCEVDLRVSAIHCGACAMRCATTPGATPTCASSACGITCNANFGNCNGNGLDGCEANLLSDTNHCGACGTACPTGANATPLCAAGRCGFACAAGFGNCDTESSNGCETPTQTSMVHCGGCGVACNAPSNSSAVCTAGRCVVSCDAGYVLSGSVCVRVAPRTVTPPAFSVTTSRRPTFRVALPPGQDGGSVEVCSNRTCTLVAFTLTLSGNRGVAPAPLPPGTYFWRVRGAVGASVVTLPSNVSEFSVSAAGAPAVDSFWGSALDANADGYADLLVGSPTLSRAQFYAGNTALFSVTASTLFTGTTSFGTAVASAGDYNADGYGDALVSAPTANTVYVYQGNASTLGTTLVQTLSAPAGTTQFGASLACAGDYNGDGFSDSLVGAPGSNRAYFYLGSASGLTTAPVPLSASTGNFGTSVAGVGDLNADGLSDFVVGTDGANAAFVYYGSAVSLVATPVTLTGPAGASGFGRAIAGAGDVNGDGYADLVIGAYNSNAAYVYYGSAAGVGATPSATLAVPGGAVQFGYAVDGVGDVSGDGYNDVVVGAPLSERAYVFFGSATGIATAPSSTLSITLTAAAYGRVVSGLGDANRDGLFDFAVGAPTRSQVNVYRGATSAPTASVVATGSTSFGSAISGL